MWSFNPLQPGGVSLPPETPPRRRAVAIVGDDSVGKTSFIQCKLHGSLPAQMLPPTTCSQVYAISAQATDETPVDVWDTGGFSGYERGRSTVYKNANVVVIMFDRNRDETLKHIPEYWMPEVKANCSGELPIIVLLGNKIVRKKRSVFGADIIDPITKKSVSAGQAEAIAKSIGAVKYLKCCTDTKKGVNEAMDEILQLAVYGPGFLSSGWCQSGCAVM